MRVLLLVALCVCVHGGPGSISWTGSCDADNDCADKRTYALRKAGSMKWDSDAKKITSDYEDLGNNGICCGMSKDMRCLDSRYDECVTKDYNGLEYNQPTSSYLEACGWGNNQCNTYSSGCVEVEDVNGYKRYGCYGQGKMTPAEGMNIVAIPLFFILATIIALLLCLKECKDALGSAEMPQKVVMLCSLLAFLWAIFLFFSAAWKYGVVLVTVASMTLLSMSADSKALSWICFFAQLACMLYVIGILPSNSFLNFGGGIYQWLDTSDCVRAYGDHFTYTNLERTSGTNTNNPQELYWGYCGRGWLTWEKIVSAFAMIGSCFVWVLYSTKCIKD